MMNTLPQRIEAKHLPLFNKPYDLFLVFAVLALLLTGLVMVASTSIAISLQNHHSAFYYLLRQLIFLGLGLVFAIFIIQTPTKTIQNIAWSLFPISLLLLVLVLIPGIGREVNGSSRWLGVAGVGFQVSELVKLFTIIFIADFLVRKNLEVRTKVQGFLRPMFCIALLAALLLKEPDFGAVVVIVTTVLSMMFFAGVRLWQFVALLGLVLTVLAGVAISSPYRLTRLTVFLNPWSTQYDTGYQLTQSLIAFGRGGWTGSGLGESVQKLFYLPEAHTDFLFAVLGEELGLVGVLAVISLFILVVARGLVIVRRAAEQQALFCAYLALGLTLWIAYQALINIGVNAGILPTKGLTLPLLSYGGSSQLVMCLVMAILFRIDYETRTGIAGRVKENWRLHERIR